jgi:hypothetical protein
MVVGLLGGGVIGVIVASVVGFLTNRREHSGQISTTEAETLWEESRSIREEQRLDNLALKQEVATQTALREQDHSDLLTLQQKYGALEEAHKQCKEDLVILTTELRRK